MPSVRELTDPYREALTRVPPHGPGICRICHGVPSPSFQVCWSCAQTTSQVTAPLDRITPISIFGPGGQLDHLLWHYKNSPAQETRTRLTLRVAALIARFLQNHRACVAPEGWGVLVPIPSTGDRPGTHPLRRALGLIPGYRDQVADLLGAGEEELDHNQASDRGFTLTRDVDGLRLLLIDDMFTTGARMQSASSVLTRAGATVVAGLAVGRRYSIGTRRQAVLDQARQQPFSFEVCCHDEEPWELTIDT